MLKDAEVGGIEATREWPNRVQQCIYQAILTNRLFYGSATLFTPPRRVRWSKFGQTGRYMRSCLARLGTLK
jgi:hypothetical protein